MKLLKLKITLCIFCLPFFTFAQYPKYKTAGKNISATDPATSFSEQTKISTKDLNNDGLPDFCVALYKYSKLEVFIQEASGSFNKLSVNVLENPVKCIIEDFNNDHNNDILVLNTSSNKLNMLLGKGDGTFINSIINTDFISRGNGVTGDFNGDGKTDLVISSGAFKFLPGNGDGTFGSASFINTEVYPESYYNSENMAMGDFNKDGNKDLVVTRLTNLIHYRFTLFNGNGNGTFSDPIDSETTNTRSGDLLISDFNQDGHEDIITSIGPYVHLNNGNGTFETGKNISTLLTFSEDDAFDGGRIKYVDLNKDDIKDFIIFYASGVSYENSKLVIIRGNADGTFTPLYKYPGGNFIMDINIEDMDSDGNKDILVRNEGNDYVSILKGNGDFTFGNDIFLSSTDNGQALFQTSGMTIGGMAFFDKNADSKIDVVTVYNNDKLAVYNGNGDATFQPQATINSSLKGLIENEDLNNDGKDDIILYATNQNYVSLLLTNPDGSSASPVYIPLADITNAEKIKITDINNDGTKDLVMLNYGNGKFEIHLGNGDGTFTYSNTLISNESFNFEIADTDNDTYLDIVAVSCSTSAVRVFKGYGTGFFMAPSSYYISTYCANLLVKDFNDDNFPDIALTNSQFNYVGVYMNNMSGGFNNQGAIYPSGSFPDNMVAEDFNNDGNIDLVCANNKSNDISFYPGLGDGKFLPGKKYSLRGYPSFIKTVDINGDGNLDIAVWNQQAKDISFLLSDGVNSWVASDIQNMLSFTTSYGTPVPVLSYNLYDKNLTSDITVKAPAEFELSTDSLTFQSTLVLPPSSGTVPKGRKIYMRSVAPFQAGVYRINIDQTTTTGIDVLTPAEFTINKVFLSVMVFGGTKTYGSTNPPFYLSYSGFVPGENETVLDQLPLISTNANESSDVGTYPVTLSGGIDNNYTLNVQNGTLTIDKASLKIQVRDTDRKVGEPDPVFELIYSGWANNDNQSSLSGSPIITTGAEINSPAGDYKIKVNQGTLTSSNYNFMFIDGVLTVKDATSTIDGNVVKEFDLFSNPNSPEIVITENTDKVREVSVTDMTGRTELYNDASVNTNMKGILIVRVSGNHSSHQFKIQKF